MSTLSKNSLTYKVLLSLVIGIVVGLVANLLKLNDFVFIHEYITDGLFLIIGNAFIAALKMLVVPIVVSSLLLGVMGLGNIKALGRIGVKSLFYYLLTTAAAIALAVAIALLFDIGSGLHITSTSQFAAKPAPPLVKVLIDIIPKNPIIAMAEGNMLQIIFFTIFSGVCILAIGEKGKPIITLTESINAVMMQMVTFVMKVAPIAVFALLARSISQLGFHLLLQLAGYVLVVTLALIVHISLILPLLFKTTTDLNPYLLLRKIRETQVFAFSTSSSNATIPVNINVTEKKLGVSKSVASFCIPFGATINMDGTAIMQGVATVFIAHIYSVDLGLSQYLIVILMAVVASIGTAGVPGVGLIMLSMVFVQVNLPLEGIGLILGVDRILDMMRTVVNVSGDAFIATIIAKSEGKLDIKTFNNDNSHFIELTKEKN